MMVSSARGTVGALPVWVDARLARVCEAALAVDPAARPTVGTLAEQVETVDRQRLALAIHRARRAADVQASLAAARDPTVGRRTRGKLLLVLGVAWIAVPVHAAVTGQVPSLLEAAVGNLSMALLGAGVYVAGLARLGRTVPNRLTLLAMTVAIGGAGLLDLWGYSVGASPTQIFGQHMLFFVAGAAILAVGVDAALWPAVLLYGAMAGLAWLRPEWIMGLTAAGNAGLVINALWVWLRGGRAEVS